MLRRLPISAALAITAVLVAAAPALAHDNGEGWGGETDDRVVTNAGFILIVFFPLFIFFVSPLQRRLEKRKYARQAAAKRAAQVRGRPVDPARRARARRRLASGRRHLRKRRAMAYFVTGATGFIGRHLVQRLLEREGDLHVLVREGSRTASNALVERWGAGAADARQARRRRPAGAAPRR